MKITNNRDLSKTLSHALRHEPWVYELELDDNGWVSVDILIDAIKPMDSTWGNLCEADIAAMINQSDKKRHELLDNKIRALYGHSVPGKLKKQAAKPPVQLYHGTAPETVSIIRSEGIKPMGRQYVHSGVEVDTAKQVGLRKSKNPVILIIESATAHKAGIQFYEGNDKIWLSDAIPPEFIRFP